MTEQQLKEIEARAEAATPGPWDRDGDMVRMRGNCGYEGHENCAICQAFYHPYRHGKDMEFVAAARTDIPALCAALREAWAEIEKMKDDARHDGIEKDLLT